MDEYTQEQKQHIVDTLAGTTGFTVDGEVVEDLEEIMLDFDYERCPECDYWCESSDLVDEDGEFCPCSSCRNYRGGIYE